MVFDFFNPVDNEIIIFSEHLSYLSVGKKLHLHTKDEFPNLENVKIALVGVLDNRGFKKNHHNYTINYIRKAFYQLFPGNWDFEIADLGDIPQGDTPNDTYYLLKNTIEYLVNKQIIPIVIGGSQDLTYAIYRGYDNFNQMVNCVSVDSKFDLNREDQFSADGFLSQMIMQEPVNLFNYANLGYQTYYNSKEEIELLDKLFFDTYRIGEISNNIKLAEPVIRDSDVISIDMTSIMSSSSGNFNNFIPNGFTGKEICALSRYAGISEKISSIGIFNHGGSESESVLIAQIIWYFIEGYQYRLNEFPIGKLEELTKYIVPREDFEMVFYKSFNTNRWWVEVPVSVDFEKNMDKNALLPCAFEDYQTALNDQIPERWWRAMKKSLS